MSLLVVAELDQLNVLEVTYELLVLGKELSSSLNLPMSVLAIGNGLNGKLNSLGIADELIIVEDPQVENFVPDYWSTIVTEVAKEKKARIVILANSSRGIDISALITTGLNGQHISSCQDAKVEGGQLVTTSLLYGGKMSVQSKTLNGTTVLSVLAGSRASTDGTVEGTPDEVRKSLNDYAIDSKTIFKKLHLPDSEDIDITQYDILVSVGRGIQDEGNIDLGKELAESINGALSASRPVIDQGWLPKTRQVGRSGKTVKPKLYLALGISGAPEHVEGMRGSDLIIAVNTDEKAPIFDIADYGIIVDLIDFVPELTDALKTRKGN